MGQVPKLKIYVFSVRHRPIFSNDWEFKNVAIKDKTDVVSAIKDLMSRFPDKEPVVIDNIYSEEV